jgi:hypothetical protein
MLWIVGQALTALAFCVAVLAFLSTRSPVNDVAPRDTLPDFGNLLLAFVMLWAYLSFAQLLIIWSGNLPEEISWYMKRLNHGWEWVAAVLLVFHFAVPFALLLSRFRKRRAETLGGIALLILAVRAVDVFWMIAPAFHPDRLVLHWLDATAIVGIGGVWVAMYAGKLSAQGSL